MCSVHCIEGDARLQNHQVFCHDNLAVEVLRGRAAPSIIVDAIDGWGEM
jgi:hypothetical protein